MNYSVDSEIEARNELASVWMSASSLDRKAITAAQAEIDRLLAFDPISKGSLLSEGLYAINFPPLRVLFEVSEESRMVNVVKMKLQS